MELITLKRINDVLTFGLIIVFTAIFITGGAAVYGASNKKCNTTNESNEIRTNGEAESQKQNYKSLHGREPKVIQMPSILQNSLLDASSSLSGTTYRNSADDTLLTTSDNSYIGEFKVTAYTAGYESTGKTPDHPEYGITASGVMVEEGITIAADWDVIPEGTWVYIEDVGYRLVQDTGGAIKGNAIDLYISELGQALDWGVKHKKVWLVDRK